jgi:transposase
MTQSFSLDLRMRVAAFVEAGHSCRAAARHFGVSDSCAIKLMQRQRQSGSLAPARQGRPPGGGKLVPYESFLIQTVEARPAITMPELAAQLLEEHGTVAAPAMLSRFLCRRGFTYKNLWTGRALQEGCFWLDERRFASIYPASMWSSCSGPSWESARTEPA